MPWNVDTAEYQGEGYWADYPPYTFDTEEEARDFETLMNVNIQMGCKSKVREVYEVDETGRRVKRS